MKTLFTVTVKNGKFYYHDDGTYTASSYDSEKTIVSPECSRFRWQWRDNMVMYEPVLTTSANNWIRDIEQVQEAYLKYINDLILEET